VEIENALAMLLRHEIDLIKRVEGLVRDLQCSPDFTPHAAYRAVDRYEEGKITKENLTDFFRQFGNYLSEAEVFSIIRRMDTDGDAKVSYEEFADFLINQVNEEAPLTKPPPQSSNGKKKKSQKTPTKEHKVGEHRFHEFNTESRQDAGIIKMIDEGKHINNHARMMAALIEANTRHNPVRPI